MKPDSSYPSIPAHIAIIMDGNGRWAQLRHRPRIFGHKAGVKTVRQLVEGAAEIGVKCLTLYSFSTENWTRPKAEIAALFKLLKDYVESDLETLHKRNVRLRILGSRKGLKPDLLAIIRRVEETTRNNTEFQLNIAFNYGSRDELLRAAAQVVADGKDISAINEAEFGEYLDTQGLPDVDLLIRTSGECRISNFLLWQAAYAEFVFTDVLWPDFTTAHLQDAIDEFGLRERRFGNLNSSETEVA